MKNDLPFSTPINMIKALFDVTMECRVPPSTRGLHEAVLDRVVMDILNVPDEVFFISDLMLPEPLLPYGLPLLV
jgi:hypothetical protein